MKLTISVRNKDEARKPYPKEKKDLVTTGPNEISKRKQIIRDRGLPESVPGTGPKSAIKNIRKNGDVPAVLYGKGINQAITIQGDQPDSDVQGFQSVLRDIKKNGLLATTIFELNDGKTVHKAIIKDVQYHVVSYAVEHVDFLRLEGDEPVIVNVPIHFVGVEECVGIKAGGFPRYVSRSIRVKCKPSEIPPLGFVANMKDLKMPGTQTSASDPVSLTVADIEIPESIKTASKTLLTGEILKQVVVAIAKK